MDKSNEYATLFTFHSEQMITEKGKKRKKERER